MMASRLIEYFIIFVSVGQTDPTVKSALSFKCCVTACSTRIPIRWRLVIDERVFKINKFVLVCGRRGRDKRKLNETKRRIDAFIVVPGGA